MLRLGDAPGVVAHRLAADLHGAGVQAGLVGQVGEQGHTGEHAVPGLVKIDGAGIVVHVDVDLVHPGQGVHHQQLLLGPVQLPAGKDVDALVPLVLQGVHEALPLDAGHVEHVQLGDDRLQAGDLGEPHVVLPHEGPHVLGDGQLPGGDEEELDALELGHGLDEGVDGAAVLQVAAQAHRQPVHLPLQAGDGGEVGGGLGGVHVAAVAGVDDRHIGVEGGRLGGALHGVAHDHHVGVAGHHCNGILQGLALGHRGGAGIGKAEHRAAHPEHGGLKGEVGAGGGLIKEAGHDPALAGVQKISGVVHDLTAPLVQ